MMRAYKLFRIRDGVLYPLYVHADTPTPIGEWLEAVPGERLPNGKVKSRLGRLAYRPGWHCSPYPIATHIGSKANPRDAKPSYRPDDQVWAEVEVEDTVDWQAEANKQGNCPRDRQLRFVPLHGYYRYKTNPMMFGEWLIAGNIKVVRILTDAEVSEINAKIGVSDLPRRAA